MTTHIDQAKAAAEALDLTGLAHPVADRVALRGILHALLALHDQATGATIDTPTAKPAPKRTTTKKADQ